MSDTQVANTPAELAAVNAEIERILQHQAAGRLEAAEAAVNTLLETYVGHPRLLQLQALNLALDGQTEAALTLLRSLRDAVPDDVAVQVDYASLLGRSGQLDDAIQQVRQAVHMAPNYALAQANLGAALVITEQFEAAITHLEKAVTLDSTILDVHLNLGQAFLRSNQFQRAVDALFRALALDPQSIAAHVNLAHALFRRERHDAAEYHARRALEMAPESGEAWMHLGNILAASGKIDEAAEALLTSSRLRPTVLAALMRLVHLRKTTADSPEAHQLAQFEAQFDKVPAQAQPGLAFALGKAAADMGDYPKAFGHFQTGNGLTRAEHPFHRDLMVSRSERLRGLIDRAFVERYREAAGDSSFAPIFDCGLPRSGTTLTEQMLSRHPQVQAGGELTAVIRALARADRIRAVLEERQPDDAITADDFTRLGETYESLVRAEGLRGAYVTDKLPSNYMYVGLMALALPRARFLILRRHPLDGLWSCYTQDFGQRQRFSTDFGDLATSYDQFDQFARHWQAVLPDQVRVVGYENLVADPKGQMRGHLEFLGLDWSEDVLDHTASSRQVNTASVAQVREPIYQTSVARWRHYGPLLSELAQALGNHITKEDRAACGLT